MPPVALGASKPTVALTPSKASYTANLSLFALSSPSLIRVLRFTMSTPRTPISTPRFVPSCLTSPCHSSSRLRTQVPLYFSPFFLLPPQVRDVYDQDSTVPPRRLSLRSRQVHLRPTRLYLRPRPLYLHRSPLCLQVYVYRREAFEKFDFRVFIV